MTGARFLTLGVLAITSLTSCLGRSDEAPPGDLIEGRWSWAFAFGGELPDTTTTLWSASDVLTFKDGAFSLSQSDSVAAEGTYLWDGPRVAVSTGESGPVLRLSVRPNLLFERDFVIRIRGDTLTFMSLVHDDYNHAFVRIDGR